MKKKEGFNYFNTFIEFCDDIIKSSEILFSTINNYDNSDNNDIIVISV